MTTKIPKRISTALIHSLSSGVVPRTGLGYITVGRRAETEALTKDLANIEAGAGGFRVVCGRYGSGKSFLLQTIRSYSLEKGFITADADLSPERRLVGTKGQGLATYRELMINFATRTRPDGGALELILQKWIAALRQEVEAENSGISDEDLIILVGEKIEETAGEMVELIHGFDFAKVMVGYWQAYKTGDTEKRQAALRWLRGEYTTKTEAKRALNVGSIITDENWYDFIKLWAKFVTKIGYKGLIVFIDEAVNLYKIPNSQSRTANYEKILSIFNDTMQGKAEHLYFLMGGTPQFVEDERRGLFSYEALRSRLMQGRYATEELRNLSAPVIRLKQLTDEEVFLLLKKLRELHAEHHGYEMNASDEELISFLENAVGRMGAKTLLTPREVIRDFLDTLDLLQQNPELRMADILKDHKVEAAKEDPDEVDDFLMGFEI